MEHKNAKEKQDNRRNKTIGETRQQEKQDNRRNKTIEETRQQEKQDNRRNKTIGGSHRGKLARLDPKCTEENRPIINLMTVIYMNI